AGRLLLRKVQLGHEAHGINFRAGGRDGGAENRTGIATTILHGSSPRQHEPTTHAARRHRRARRTWSLTGSKRGEMIPRDQYMACGLRKGWQRMIDTMCIRGFARKKRPFSDSC